MASPCPLTVPADPASLGGPPVERPSGLIPWGAAQVAALRHQHRLQFSPLNATDDGWAAAIRASVARCHSLN